MLEWRTPEPRYLQKGWDTASQAGTAAGLALTEEVKAIFHRQGQAAADEVIEFAFRFLPQSLQAGLARRSAPSAKRSFLSVPR